MLVVGALLPSVLAKQERFRASLEPLATAYMLPLFGSPHAFLRAKAVWVAGQYASELEFEAPGAAKRCKGQGALFDQLFDLVLKCMKDPCAPALLHGLSVATRACPRRPELNERHANMQGPADAGGGGERVP